MKTLQFHVSAALPENLNALWDLAKNVWWSWNADAISLFRRISPDTYSASGPCPLKLLNTLPNSTWEELSKDRAFLEHLEQVHKKFTQYMTIGNGRIEALSQNALPTKIGYFSMEYGLHESIPLYSGGLGILAGDHLKTASDLSLPLVAVGLFYFEGYFNQKIDKDGWQREYYEYNDPFFMPMQPVLDERKSQLKISVNIAGNDIFIRVWRLDVGKIPLFLLDTNLPENPVEARSITSRLYSGGHDLRIQQELVLGIGGVRALKAMNIEPSIYHLNEGHSAFLALERISQSVAKSLTWQESLALIKASQIFTVHTPVPAGNDAFEINKLRKYLGDISHLYKMPTEEFYNLGKSPEQPDHFSMPVFAIRTSSIRNGVSKLHKIVSQNIWKPLWPKLQEKEIPIIGITNGVHTKTWLSSEMSDLFNRYLGKGWDTKLDDKKLWERLEIVPDSEIWDIHQRRKSRLIASVIKNVEKSELIPYGWNIKLKDSLKAEYLTIGFARRFATYKRGSLFLKNLPRLKKIILNDERPVQIFIAGKAHPRDNAGKEVIQYVCRALEKEGLSERIVFLENYDMNLAQRLVRGVDVWLNTPIRKLEASGTSGMKVGLNGGLNLSILDGWWDEGYDGENGWAIAGREDYNDDNVRDDVQSNTLYSMLEQEIVPKYYESSVPTDWIYMMKKAIATITPEFSAQRMVLDYVKLAYIPLQKNIEQWLLPEGLDVNKIRKYVNDIEKLKENWNKLKIVELNTKPSSTLNVGEQIIIKITLEHTFPENWVNCVLMRADAYHHYNQTVYGDEDEILTFKYIEKNELNRYVYEIKINAENPGVRNYSIRISPNENLFPDMLDLHLITRYE